MALEIVRCYIVCYDADYLTHYENRLDVRDTVCRSCGRSFKQTWVYVDMQAKNAVKRHLACAIAHNVTTVKEAKELAQRKGLPIDWTEIQSQASQYLDSRRTQHLAIFSWVMGAVAFIGLVPVVPL